jgi:hypothetical protein
MCLLARMTPERPGLPPGWFQNTLIELPCHCLVRVMKTYRSHSWNLKKLTWQIQYCCGIALLVYKLAQQLQALDRCQQIGQTLRLNGVITRHQSGINQGNIHLRCFQHALKSPHYVFLKMNITNSAWSLLAQTWTNWQLLLHGLKTDILQSKGTQKHRIKQGSKT